MKTCTATWRCCFVRLVSTPEMHRLGENDVSQLIWASQKKRALVTFNVRHFARLHHELVAQANHHAGIVVSQQRDIGQIHRRLLNLVRTLNDDEMQDRLEFLSNWAPI